MTNVKKIVGKQHQVLTKPGKKGIYLRRFACMRSNCICGNVKSCDISKENPVFNNCKDEVTSVWHDFEKVELTSYDNTTDSDEGSDEEDFIETFATTVIKKGNIVIIRADDHLYYLGILMSEICKTEAAERDNY